MFIPEPLCWTEAPQNLKSFYSQRDRWSRGFTETIIDHRYRAFNPKYRLFGLISFPYYLCFEWLTPFIEIFGLIWAIILASLGIVPLEGVGLIVLCYWGIGFIMNTIAVTCMRYTFGKKINNIGVIVLFSAIEPIYYHWLNSFIYIIGNVNLLFGKKGWGEMTREGFKIEKDGTNDTD